VFWLPDQPDNRVPGHLILPEQGSPTVELHGAFTPVMGSISGDPGTTDLLVYGFLENVPRLVTLVD
jgi:hypothetical protein